MDAIFFFAGNTDWTVAYFSKNFLQVLATKPSTFLNIRNIRSQCVQQPQSAPALLALRKVLLTGLSNVMVLRQALGQPETLRCIAISKFGQ
jgi:hypothetical protein